MEIGSIISVYIWWARSGQVILGHKYRSSQVVLVHDLMGYLYLASG
jgi:hypothetical protein